MWLFLTEEKPNYMPQVRDRLESDLLNFEGQPLGRTDKLIINHQEFGLEILLFFRKSKTEFPDSGFRYCGLFQYVYHEGDHPTRFLLGRITAPILTNQIMLDTSIVEDIAEGEKKLRLTSYYERNPRLRLLAINHHGLSCYVCDFNFEKKYGELGRAFIEVHHLVPLHTLIEAVNVDPKTEMITVRSNCHRMLHRNRDEIVSPDELRALLNHNT